MGARETRDATVAGDDDEAAFRRRVRAWLADNAPVARGGEVRQRAADTRPGSRDIENAKAFQASLFEAGLAGLTWPPEYGGQGLANHNQRIFNEEATGYALPTRIFAIGLGMCAPTILEHGTEDHKRRYLRPMLRGDEIWCQLFSEPGAGSDVASLQTRATPIDDGWLLNGQKVWTSGAHYSDFGPRHRAHRPSGAQASRPVDVHRGHEGRRRSDRPPAASDHGRGELQRGLLRGRARAP